MIEGDKSMLLGKPNMFQLHGSRHLPLNHMLEDYFTKKIINKEQKEEELLKITNSLNLAQEVAKIGSWDYDVTTNFVYCSDSLYTILGLKKETDAVPTYDQLLDMIHPEEKDYVDNLFLHTKQTGTDMDLEYRVEKGDHSFITVHTKAVAKRDHNGEIIRIIGILHDISEILITESRLKESEEKLDKITNNIDVGIWSADLILNQLVYASPAIEKLSGYSLQDFLSGKKNWEDLIYHEDLKIFEGRQAILSTGEMLLYQYRIIAADGEVKWIEDKIFPTLDSEGNLIRLDGFVQDISERKQNEEMINFFAYHDYLTELPNRRKFDQELKQLISEYEINQEKFALFYLDVDRFKFINDTLGHEIGDELLKEVSRRISSVASNDDVFRIGGDEYAIIQRDLGANDPAKFGRQLISEFERPFQIEEYEFHITTSIGICIFPEDGETLKKLKMNTDIALYRAKELGKNNVQLFTKSLNNKYLRLFTLGNDLRKAIRNNELILYYQPRVDTMTSEMIGAEALIRWNHPKLGLVSPAEFIPLAEETGFINEITDWVILEVCKQLQEWRGNGYQLVPISINLSGKSLMKADLVQKIKNTLSSFCVSPSLIEMEITENSFIKNNGTELPTIQQLRDLGISISIDDFGTGYSSIGYLKKFNVDYIKIDRSFIKDIDESNEDFTIVQSIILLAKGFNIKIVAEGVETEKQWELLKLLNCHYLQGYLFSKPLPVKEFSRFLQ